MTGRHYTEGETGGYVVESRCDYPRRDGSIHHGLSYWYGPDHGFGTTSGPLDYSAVVWPTRAAAMKALNSVYGSPAVWTRRGYSVRRVATVLAERRAVVS